MKVTLVWNQNMTCPTIKCLSAPRKRWNPFPGPPAYLSADLLSRLTLALGKGIPGSRGTSPRAGNRNPRAKMEGSQVITSRATLFFESGKYGWSETYFRQAETLQDTMGFAQFLAASRAKLMGYGVGLTYLRCSDDAVRRDALVDRPQLFAASPSSPAQVPTALALQPGQGYMIIPPGANIVKPAVGKLADVPYSAILVRMESGSEYHRLVYMRGCPDDIIVNPAGPILEKAWKDSFDAFLSQLVKGAWGFMAVSRNTTRYPLKPIVGQLVADPWTVEVTGHGFAKGDTVRVAGVRGHGKLPNGLWTVVPVDTNHFQLYGYAGPLTLAWGGTVQLQKREFIPIKTALIRGETHRDTGRPFDSPVGRRKKRDKTSPSIPAVLG